MRGHKSKAFIFKFLFPALINLALLVLSSSFLEIESDKHSVTVLYSLVFRSSGPTQDEDRVQTSRDLKVKEGTAAQPNLAGLLHQFDRCWGTLTQLWMKLLGDRAVKHRSRGRTGDIFFLSLCKTLFYTLGGNFHQVSLATARLNLIKSGSGSC